MENWEILSVLYDGFSGIEAYKCFEATDPQNNDFQLDRKEWITWFEIALKIAVLHTDG